MISRILLCFVVALLIGCSDKEDAEPEVYFATWEEVERYEGYAYYGDAPFPCVFSKTNGKGYVISIEVPPDYGIAGSRRVTGVKVPKYEINRELLTFFERGSLTFMYREGDKGAYIVEDATTTLSAFFPVEYSLAHDSINSLKGTPRIALRRVK